MSALSRTRSAFRFLLLSGLILAGLGACSDDDDDDSGSAETTEESGETTETTEQPADESVFDVAVGDCLSEEVTGDVTEVPIVPCDQPHQSEVYFIYTIEEDAFPGRDGLDAIIEEQCLPQFESFVGVPYLQSEIEVTTLEPTDESWDLGDRELVCMVQDPAGPVTASLEGANR
jgi:Septum formation